MTKRARQPGVAGQRVQPGEALRQRAQPVRRMVTGQQADLASQHRRGQRNGELQPVLAQVQHMLADRQFVGQPACHAEEHRGRDSFVAKSEQFILRRPAGEVERRDGLNHYEPLFCSMCSDMVGEVPQRRECLAYLAIVGLQLEAVGP
jgi:hypothetical protein